MQKKVKLSKSEKEIEENILGYKPIPSEKHTGYLVQERKFFGTDSVFDEAIKAFVELKELETKAENINTELSTRDDYESNDYNNLLEDISIVNERLVFLENIYTEASVEKVLKGLGFNKTDFTRPLNEFSGGWQMRVELAKLLLSNPDLLLLDEPTNHLDIDSIQWLEEYLSAYHGAVILVSHDRLLLDKVTNRTIEIENGKLFDYPVSYSSYIIQRADRIAQLRAEQKNQAKEIEKNQEFIERFRYKATKAKQVQSRVKMLEKIDRIEVEENDRRSIHFKFRPAIESGKVVTEVKAASKAYSGKIVFNAVDFIIAKNERIAFIGKNGEGKSTLIKMLTQKIDYSGNIKIGHNVKIGYFAQNQIENLNPKLTVYETLEEISDSETRPKLRGLLGNFLFSGEDIDKKVSILSGGEKTRLALARMLLQPVNFLILDEPTNHLDMIAKDVLKQALLHFNGTLIIVSHDRHFLSGLTNRIFEFRNQKIMQHHFSIEELLELNKKKGEERKEEKKSSKSKKNISKAKEKYLNKKENEREKKKTERLIIKTEEDISTTEKKIKELEILLSQPDKISVESNFNDISKEHRDLNIELETKIRLWEELHKKLS